MRAFLIGIFFIFTATSFAQISIAEATASPSKSDYPLVMRASLHEVFLNGGMCGKKVFTIEEVVRGTFPDSMVAFFICNNVDYRDYYREVLLYFSDTTYEYQTWSVYYPEHRMDEFIGFEKQPKTNLRYYSVTPFIQPVNATENDYPNFNETSPIDFLKYLQNFNLTSLVIDRGDVPKNWIQKKHLDPLLDLLDSKDPAIPVYEDYNVDRKQYSSTIGNEVLFLLEGYLSGQYPPGGCSLGYWTKDGKVSDFETRKQNVLNLLKNK